MKENLKKTRKANVEDFRNPPGFKIVKELERLDYNVGIFDPYFDYHVKEKIFKENNIVEQNFKILNDIKKESIKDMMECVLFSTIYKINLELQKFLKM